jgi:hypothetical protein
MYNRRIVSIFKEDMNEFLREDIIYLKGLKIRLEKLKRASKFTPKILNYNIIEIDQIIEKINLLLK